MDVRTARRLHSTIDLLLIAFGHEKTPENLNRSLEVLANMSEADPVGTRHLLDSMPPGQFPFHEWSKRWERN